MTGWCRDDGVGAGMTERELIRLSPDGSGLALDSRLRGDGVPETEAITKYNIYTKSSDSSM
ncbi:hypothetical protein TspCOW1_21250 [Thiohalobacter sp. COW1]|nr:hypothetical protein TspCOW1_21250 [Thiohalobacter sp. COW1]